MLSRTIVPLWLVLAASSASAQVTPPAEHLGRPVGRDFELADWTEVSSYFERLGSESPRVDVRSVGSTTEGRSFLLATISSEENLENIDAIRAASKRLADPRGLDDEGRERLLAEAKPVLFASIGMHSTETAAPQFGMEMAYELATSDAEPYRTVREEMVVLIAPCLNPDGLDHVVNWYRQTVGTPYESSGLLKLYQYYSGHDNNRDWFMLSQAETRIVTEILYGEWFPQVYWDVHQQGSTRERMFVPPFRDPLNPNLDPGIIAGIGQLGARALFDMTREGFTGVSTGVTYDMWWNGGNRNVPVRHNIIGLLTEAASARLATPIFQRKSELRGPKRGLGYAPSNIFPDPWPGGWWRIRDIIDYQVAFGKSLVGSLSREPKLWLDNALKASRNAMAKAQAEGPVAWLIPSDNPDRGAVKRLVDTLLVGGVEIHRAEAELTADGRTYPAGTLVLKNDQPYARYVKDLFEVQRYPQGEPPYDVAGWTLPVLMGIRRVEVKSDLAEDAPLARITTPDASVAVGFGEAPKTGQALSTRNSEHWTELFKRLARSEAHVFNDGKFAARSEDARDENGQLRPAKGRIVSEMPRIGLYNPWSGSMDEGWMRFVFDLYEMPHITVRNEMLRAGDLSEFLDVLVFPSISGRQLDDGRSPGSVPEEFARGLDPEGAIAIEEFVRAGGKLVCVGSSAQWAIDLLRLPLVDVTRGGDADGFSCPGSVLRAIPVANALTSGLDSSQALFFSRSSAWRAMTADEKKEAEKEGPLSDREWKSLLDYAPTRVLLSGYIARPEVIAGRHAWVRTGHGKGTVHLFGFRPQYRGWSQATFQLLFRAMLID